LLPKPNIDLLSVLIKFLAEVATYAVDPMDPNGGNKMNLQNLATVIAPNILYSEVPEHSVIAIHVVRLMLENNQILFKVFNI
jgi:hypothetical protein